MTTFTKITFKDEGEVNGEPVGSVVLSTQDSQERCSGRWMTLRQARSLAADNDWKLEEF
jgi:hypothetical protein